MSKIGGRDGQFNEAVLEEKLRDLDDTQESIQALSRECMHLHEHHKKIVSIWFAVLKKVGIDERIRLFYLANDVIQHSKRKGLIFVDTWATALQRAITLVRNEKIRSKIERLINIWRERNIYDDAFLSDLTGLLTATIQKDVEPEFTPSTFFNAMKKNARAWDKIQEKKDLVNVDRLLCLVEPDCDVSKICAEHVFDLRSKEEVMLEVDASIKLCDDYVLTLKEHQKVQKVAMEEAAKATKFYENQRGDAKTVSKAYKSFGIRLEKVKERIEEKIPLCPSPMPSPDPNAPSPSSDLDLDIPDHSHDHNYDIEKTFSGDFSEGDPSLLSNSVVAIMENNDWKGFESSSFIDISVNASNNSVQENLNSSLPFLETGGNDNWVCNNKVVQFHSQNQDVDHRANGARKFQRPQPLDMDYRSIPMPLLPPPPPPTNGNKKDDNVESVDMDLSEDEEGDGKVPFKINAKKGSIVPLPPPPVFPVKVGSSQQRLPPPTPPFMQQKMPVPFPQMRYPPRGMSPQMTRAPVTLPNLQIPPPPPPVVTGDPVKTVHQDDKNSPFKSPTKVIPPPPPPPPLCNSQPKIQGVQGNFQRPSFNAQFRPSEGESQPATNEFCPPPPHIGPVPDGKWEQEGGDLQNEEVEFQNGEENLQGEGSGEQEDGSYYGGRGRFHPYTPPSNVDGDGEYRGTYQPEPQRFPFRGGGRFSTGFPFRGGARPTWNNWSNESEYSYELQQQNQNRFQRPSWSPRPRQPDGNFFRGGSARPPARGW